MLKALTHTPFARTLSCAAAGLIALTTAAQAGSITVYSALEEDEIATYLEAAKKALPDTEINVLRLSTGDLGARLVAESANPQADVIWGFAVTNMMDARILDQLEPYEAKGSDALPASYKDAAHKWFAATGYMGAFCVNTEVLKAKGLPMPTSWEDLTDPAFKGEVVMPDPSSSGTGYLQVAAILQGNGEEKGWDLLERLDKTMAQYTTSGSKPCKMARSGEYAVGASLSFVAMQSVEAGYPVKMVLPSDWEGYELEASGLVKGSDNAAEAKAFLDWTLSPEAAKLYTAYKAIITIPGVEPSETAAKAGLPADLSTVLYPMDFAKSAAERDTILSTWKAKIGQ
jgi:iron(III) transport system substrate-binding protein